MGAYPKEQWWQVEQLAYKICLVVLKIQPNAYKPSVLAASCLNIATMDVRRADKVKNYSATGEREATLT